MAPITTHTVKVTLESVSKQIDQSVLRSDEASRARFKDTVLAIYDIIQRKLYRLDNRMNLEQYFRLRWNISRAQAYRLFNCAIVLNELNDFDIYPNRERYCRMLKQLTKNREQRVVLWSEVLRRCNNDEAKITSTVISAVWSSIQDLVTNKSVASDSTADTISAEQTGTTDEDIAVQALLQAHSAATSPYHGSRSSSFHENSEHTPDMADWQHKLSSSSANSISSSLSKVHGPEVTPDGPILPSIVNLLHPSSAMEWRRSNAPNYFSQSTPVSPVCLAPIRGDLKKDGTPPKIPPLSLVFAPNGP